MLVVELILAFAAGGAIGWFLRADGSNIQADVKTEVTKVEDEVKKL